MNTIVVKIGSNVITRKDGTLDITRMSALVDQVAELHKRGNRVLLVSSGAVAAGRNEVAPSHRLDTVSARQLYSAVGQAKLINRYYELFHDHGLVCGQILTTKEGFGSRTHYLNQKHCMEVMLGQGVIPVINENDTVSVTELMFTDNDELSGLVATMMDADKLIILSNIDGIFDGDPKLPESKVIREVSPSVDDLSDVVVAGKSSFGRGGMLTKCRIALKVASEGIEVVIANGKKDNILLSVMDDSAVLCTRILPGERVNGVKKWIAHSHDFVKGRIFVNEGATAILLDSDRASSLLPVGVTDVEGMFEKGDLVEIVDFKGRRIGVGCSEYPSASLRENVGKKGMRPAVHYDYLYMERQGDE
ncbi:MAG: glutamate 5-kinase [Muribaculaceae bacterium]|nr:glutamate 5-kinase [Muribaculaceae bacterium]